jgi:Ca-activated chloride channel homolog
MEAPHKYMAGWWGIVGWVGLGMALVGCSASSADMGATPGGAQDNDLAQTQIEQGGVPKPEAITVEGMLNSHDLPLDAVACEKDLCINAALGVAPALDTHKSAIFLQMGFGSGIDAATFHRSPLNLAVVVDRSGSMAGTKLMAVQTALSHLLDQLGEADRLALVSFDQNVSVLRESAPVSDRESIRALLPQITPGGTTDMGAGLRVGFEQVGLSAGQAGVSDRVMVLTDAETNTGDTSTATFVSLAQQHAARGIGLTVFGVGTDLNQDLVLAITKLRGGNYIFLQDSDKISTVFDTDFDYLVTPLAYDLKFTLVPAAGFRVARVYGYPAWQVGSATAEIDVATVFLSRNHGALVARLEPSAGWPAGQPPIGELGLTYIPAAGGEAVTQAFASSYGGTTALADNTIYYSETPVRRTVAFVNAALGEHDACTLYWNGNVSSAVSLLDETERMLESESAALDDLELSEEAANVAKLRLNMQSRPPNQATNTDESGDGPMVPFSCTLGGARPGHAGWLPVVGLVVAIGAARRRRQQIRRRHRSASRARS